MSMTFNPFALCSAQEMSALLMAICGTGLSEREEDFMRGQVEALAPALVCLRDAGKLDLNVLLVAEYASLGGFERLSVDASLPDDVRSRCAQMRQRWLDEEADLRQQLALSFVR
jgi:hypothetical protein